MGSTSLKACVGAAGLLMGKHGSQYARIERDHYPTPNWVIAALAEHIDLNGLLVWEPAAGNGGMVEALRCAGCARVYASDIVDYGNGQDKVLDFLSVPMPKLARAPDLICTNPPIDRGKLATAFVEVGLRRLGKHGLLPLLLPCDFDSAKSRALPRRLPVLRWQDRAATTRGERQLDFQDIWDERPSRNPGHHTGARSNYDHEEAESSRG